MFAEGEIYRRTDIHDTYGGNRQSGISPSSRFPYIFIFTGASGQLHGYKDEWLNRQVFSYSGEGQKGDMQFTKGNMAVRDHIKNSKRIFLFEYVSRGVVRYVSEMTFLDFGYFETHDSSGSTRIGIKFFFQRVNVLSEYQVPEEFLAAKTLSEGSIEYGANVPNATERQGLVTSRVGQGAYRKSILHRWEFKCAVSGFADARVLIASHIVPWKNATDVERLDVDNGILLSPDYDALFDRHIISFENSGKIILPGNLTNRELEVLGISGKEKIQSLSEGNKKYLEAHRTVSTTYKV